MCDHLQRRSARYYIRRRIPEDLVLFYGKVVFQQALGTSDPVLARKLCRRASVALDMEWDAVRAGHRSNTQITIDPTQLLDVGLVSTVIHQGSAKTPSVVPRRTLPALVSSPLTVKAKTRVGKPIKADGTPLRKVVNRWAAERKPTDRTVHRTHKIVEEFERRVDHTPHLLIMKAMRV
jgi:hypothetical protein